MGSLCKPQKLTTTQSASTTALQPYADTYKQLLNRGLDVSNTAYNPATNAGVADFSDPQRAAFGLTQQNVGAYQPYLAAATGAAGLGAAPSYMNVGQYMNPFDQYVTGSLLSDYDQMINRNRQMSMSDAAKAGALTGDRRYVAQSIGQEGLDRALASNLAQTRQAGYNTALGATQADALRQLQATGVLSNLGGMAQQYGYNDVNAMLGIGGLQQAQQQKELDTATQNALRQSAYPFETADWAKNFATGLGGAAGSSSTGQTTQPGPSYFQQILGAATAAAGAYAKSDERIKDDIEEIGSTHDGQPIYRYRLEGSPKHEIGLLAQNVEKTHPEAVSSIGGIKHVNYKTATEDAVRGKYALGGGMPYGGGLSYVPQIQMQPVRLAASQFPTAAKPESGMNKILENFNTAHDTLSGLGKLGDTFSTPISTTKDANSGWTTTTSQSGFGPWLKNTLGDLGGLAKYLPFNHGGVVRNGYQFGGLAQENPFDYYTSYVPDNSNFVDRTQAAFPEPTAPQPQNWETVTTQEKPTGLMALGGPKEEEQPQGNSLFGLQVSPEAADALMAAGFGMMASPSPFAGQAIGEGGLAGIGLYSRLMKNKEEQQNELKKALIQHAVSGSNKPSAVQEYEYWKDLPKDEQERYLNIKRQEQWKDAGDSWVNPVSGMKIPKNIFGAEEQKELGKASGVKKGELDTVNNSFAQSILQDKNFSRSVDRAKGLASQFTTGMGSVFDFAKSSPQSDLAILMKSIKANLAFDALKELKKAGGTLGAVSEKELSLLESAYGSLEQSQSYDQFMQSLNEIVRIKAEYASLRKGAYEDYIKNYGEGKVPEYVQKAVDGTLVIPTEQETSSGAKQQKEDLRKKFNLIPRQ